MVLRADKPPRHPLYLLVSPLTVALPPDLVSVTCAPPVVLVDDFPVGVMVPDDVPCPVPTVTVSFEVA